MLALKDLSEAFPRGLIICEWIESPEMIAPGFDIERAPFCFVVDRFADRAHVSMGTESNTGRSYLEGNTLLCHS